MARMQKKWSIHTPVFISVIRVIRGKNSIRQIRKPAMRLCLVAPSMILALKCSGMRFIFQLRFHTEFGQSLLLSGDHTIFGMNRVEQALPLRYFNGQLWYLTLDLPTEAVPDADISYHYVLRDKDGSLIHDFGRDRVINPAKIGAEEVLIVDSWNDPSFYENAFYTEPFKEVLLHGNQTEVRVEVPARVTHVFKVKAPLLGKEQTLCLLGNTGSLGHWNTSRPILLNRLPGEDYLSVSLDLSSESFPIYYKYGVYDVAQKVFVRYEGGDNRELHDSIAAGKQTIVNDGFAVLPSATWKGAGVAIPIFSLRSEKSFGIGEFTDLKLLTDWCKRTGLKLIQILPINDTTATHTWLDSYPYAAISAFALHPIYLNLSQLAGNSHQERLAGLEEEKKRLNSLETVDYEAVSKVKLAFIKEIYPSQKAKTFKNKDYERFFEQNRHWLVPYAIFCCLRDKYGTPDFNQWPDNRKCTAKELALATSGSVDPEFYYFIQFHLHLQLKEATEYAHANGIILKGDIPIGVYRYGADAWQQPELYHLDMQAGAPPDAFSATGQNWSFPTYNWSRMKEDGYAWWKQRFHQMSHYFDAFRIDHILGFFRIWSIPLNAVEGLMGIFVPALPVHESEFGHWGIQFNYDRFLKPYITDSILDELFKTDASTVKNNFLQPAEHGQYSLRAEFATQRTIESWLDSLEKTNPLRMLKQGLFDLVGNVILFQAEKPHQYHFRFAIQDTLSFKGLDLQAQSKLQALYINYYFRRQDEFWKNQAMEKLPALKSGTNMLVCGEDLGLVPHCVPEVMRNTGILSLEVQRMPKTPGLEFLRFKDVPYLSVVTPSTHDMSTIRGWWEEDQALTQKFYNHELAQHGAAPKYCEAWINQAIVLQHLYSPAMWSIFQLQDLLGIDAQLRRENPAAERINVPASAGHYWCYRMHLTLENLLKSSAFNDNLKGHIQQSGR